MSSPFSANLEVCTVSSVRQNQEPAMSTPSSLPSESQFQQLLLGLLVLVMILRLIGLGEYPIMDTTEARYAEIARRMLVSGNWIVPMYTQDVPFWGKPPLAFWFSAGSMGLMGIGEFAARFPSWLCSLGVFLLLYPIIGMDRRKYVLACLIFATSTLGYTATGDVTTDPVLTLLVTATLVGFWVGMVKGRHAAYFLGFAALGASMLAKGPVALVLAGIPVVLYLLIKKQMVRFLLDARLVIGVLLAVIISVPWYLLMEQQSEGFLEYFIVGEHFQRFVDSGWQGDRYGAGHSEPYGMIWIFALEGLLPWSLVLLLPLAWQGPHRPFAPSGLPLFLGLWVLSPLMLFSFSANILPSYFMPALPAAAILTAGVVISIYDSLTGKKPLLISAIIVFAVSIPVAKFLAAINSDDWYTEHRNQKPVIESIMTDPTTADIPIYYVGRRRFSAEFYAGGLVHYLESPGASDLTNSFVAISDQSDQLDEIPDFCRITAHRSQYLLYRCEDAE
jgi:4-amino-4-deoxy-L-arabinose transferase-like glycosyltransferase